MFFLFELLWNIYDSWVLPSDLWEWQRSKHIPTAVHVVTECEYVVQRSVASVNQNAPSPSVLYNDNPLDTMKMFLKKNQNAPNVSAANVPT